MKSPLTLVFFLLIFRSYGQNIDCTKFLSQKLELDNPKTIIDNLKNFMPCGGVDAIDVQIFSQGPILGSLMISNTNTKKIETYRDLLEVINKARSYAGYPTMRKQTINLNTLTVTKALPDNWEVNKPLLQPVYNEVELNGIHDFLLSHPNQNWTYRDLVIAYQQARKDETATQDKRRRESLALMRYNAKKQYASLCDTSKLTFVTEDIIAINDYEAGLALSKKIHKPPLIYFNAYGAIYCRKLESVVFADPKIHAYLNNFIIISLSVDDRTPLSKTLQYQSKSRGYINTVGNKNADLQALKFNANSQPFLSVLNSSGMSLTNSISYGPAEDFLKFLVDAKSKWDKNNN